MRHPSRTFTKENKMNTNNFYEERKSVADCMKRLYDRGLTTASGGNISLRLDDEKFCITPSSLDKGDLTPEVIAIVKFDGTNMTPDLRLSIETEMHRLVLLARPDMNAVVHAHPIYASAYSTQMPTTLNTRLTAESYCVLGDVVNVPYSLMGTQSLAQAVAETSKKYKTLLMENHGALVMGKTLLSAFDAMDLLERAAMMTHITQSMANSHELTEAQLEEIRKM